MDAPLSWSAAPVREVRQRIARAILDGESIDARLGEVVLRSHQRHAAERLIRILNRHGGAMLAEPVGVGKTYTALAVAARIAQSILVVAPASLRAMWREEAQRCGVTLDIATHEAFSRGNPTVGESDLIIIDEAHRLRSPGTQRYERIAKLCARSRVLLVTATPVHNRRDDLAAQLALFLGRVAWQMPDEALAELVVRDSRSTLDSGPRLDGPHRIALDVDDLCLAQILALPDPIPARDESLAGALMRYGLVHQWTSSRAALAAALRRRRARGLALAAALESGRRPTRGELAAWTRSDDAVQLAFPEIIASTDTGDGEIGGLALAVDRHNAAVEALLRTLRTSPDPDDARVAALARIRAEHPGARIIAFSQYAETVNRLGARLAHLGGIATLTGGGARVASGSISRAAVLRQFTPGGGAVSARERIDMLLATDLLSEGLNLQQASVIVHLDLPWNPARLDQRVGRALRLGSTHEAVTVYVIAPAAPAEQLLRIEARLRDKLSLAQRSIGVAGRILPSPLGEVSITRGLAEKRGAFDAVLRGWLADTPSGQSSRCLVASVATDRRGFLALASLDGDPVHVADLGDGPTMSIDVVARAVDLCDRGNEAVVDPARVQDAIATVSRWMSMRAATAMVDLGVVSAARARRAALSRAAQMLARAPRHRRSSLAPLVDAARAVASAPLAEGAERILEMLVAAELPDEAWLRSIAAFGELNARPRTRGPASGASDVLALILFDASPPRNVADTTVDGSTVDNT